MPKTLKIIAVVLFIALGACFAGTANANETIKKTVTVFHSPYCPHCHHLLAFIDSTLKDKYPNVKFDLKDTTQPSTEYIWNAFKKAYGVPLSQTGVPQTYIDGEIVLGFGTAETTGQQIINLIEKEANE